ncbi:hypothetical protein [Vibrio crassostreae]|uniref:hypothetical protein n=1 Tax=Vibrio crassostreae TaxID=246167 RepID=UPI001B31342C|nr:hypothetical protein [Vibrio crassostreae]
MLDYLSKSDVIPLHSTSLEAFKCWRENARAHYMLGEENDDGYIVAEVIFEIIDQFKKVIRDGKIPQLGVSFGKDSSLLLLLYVIAMVELKLEGFEPERNGIVVHSNTKVDNPEIGTLAKNHWNKLTQFIVNHDLKIDTVLAEPSFSQSFVGRVITGRGLPTTVAASVRQCSQDLKVLPSKSATKAYFKENGIKPGEAITDDNVVLFLGSRDDESVIRKNSIEKFGGTSNPFSLSYDSNSKRFNAYFIKHITTTMVWEALTFSGTDKILPSFTPNYDDVIEVYANSSGECVMFDTSAKDAEKSKSCGTRHGCWSCLVSGGKDKSMEALINNDDRYSYLKQLNRVRNYMSKTHWDWSLRVVTNRSIHKGYVKIQPDLYNFEKVDRILRGLLTADALEQDRAYDTAQRIMSGDLDDTDKNWALAEPRYQHVTFEDILMCEFLWSFHQLSPQPYLALQAWKDVIIDGKYDLMDDVDDMEEVKRTPQPKEHYLFVGDDWSQNGQNQGLIDHEWEAVCFDSDGVRETHKTAKHTFETMHMELDKSISVNSEHALDIELSIDRYLERGVGLYPTHSAITLLRKGAIRVAKGKQGKYHEMAMRQQFFSYLKLGGSVSLDYVLQRNDLTLLSREEFVLAIEELISKNKATSEGAEIDGESMNNDLSALLALFANDGIEDGDLEEDIEEVLYTDSAVYVENQISLF